MPRFKFPQFSLSVNKKHYSNEAESIKSIEEIILPSYVKEERKRLSKPDQAALVIFHVFRGQITERVKSFPDKQHRKSFRPRKHDKSSAASRPNCQRLC